MGISAGRSAIAVTLVLKGFAKSLNLGGGSPQAFLKEVRDFCNFGPLTMRVPEG